MIFSNRPLPFVLCSSHHGTLIVNHKDGRMLDDTQGYGVGHQILAYGHFDPLEVDIARVVLQERRAATGGGVVALDCGANIGVHAVEWARLMHGWGQVLAFEAQERIYYALAGNLAINNCFNARAMHAALGSSAGTLSIPRPDYNQPGSFGSLELVQKPGTEFIGQAISYAAADCDPVPMIAIDDLDLARIDFIKMDVEGMELEVLAGAARSIDRHKPIMLIEQLKVDPEALRDRLAAWGYAVHSLGQNVLAVHPADPAAAHIHVGPQG